jgi:acylglycerol lipase
MSHFEFEGKAFDGLRLYFQGWQADTEAKGAVCLVHGLGEHSGRYTQWAEWLNNAGYSVLSFDLRGHGKSGGQRGHVLSYEEYFRDVDIALQETKARFPKKAVFLYGHSLGGMIVAEYVLRRKPKLAGAIITALSYQSSLVEQKMKVLLVKLLGGVIPKMQIDTGLVPATLSHDPEVVSRYINDPLVHHISSLGMGKATLASIAWGTAHAGGWALPVLVMHGELDRLGFAQGSRDFASKITGDCTLRIWPGLFHEIHNEPEKDQVFGYLRDWLDRHSQS